VVRVAQYASTPKSSASTITVTPVARAVVNTVYVKSLVGQISAPERKLEKVITTGQYL
jgi:hypothetical protein